MWDSLTVYHSTRDRAGYAVADYFVWRTCQRSLYIGDRRLTLEGLPSDRFEKFEGYHAYRLLLEIVAGLRSNLFGETEVLHQFKQHFTARNLPTAPFGSFLANLRDNLIEDARSIRSRYLINLGDQSYGGVAHRLLGDRRDVLLVGSGQLAQKILPWLKKSGRHVRLAARNAGRRNLLAENFSVPHFDLESCSADLKICATGQPLHLVIAAPVSVQAIANQLDEGVCIVDLRDDPLADQFKAQQQYHSFAEIMASLKATRQKHADLKERLKVVLDDLVHQRKMAHFEFVHCWEDITCLAI